MEGASGLGSDCLSREPCLARPIPGERWKHPTIPCRVPVFDASETLNQSHGAARLALCAVPVEQKARNPPRKHRSRGGTHRVENLEPVCRDLPRRATRYMKDSQFF